MAAVKHRLTPTLFDKLVADSEISGMRDSDTETPSIARENFRFYTVPRLERFNENALRATIRRDLAWLLNTTHFEALHDLEPYERVRTSVINYGVPDLAGKSMTRKITIQRAREIRDSIRVFEPRLEPEGLAVDPVERQDRINAVTFEIKGDITAAAMAMPVKFHTHLDPDSASVEVQE
jgi:type VI secretion system protein ImpF